ncbi:MAG TPA: hypothetical protein VNB22_21420 [Pyrinomonadaceae bacterium]|jgi:hypothetical protein|nr:hypothetical protein [Pyrinomonadaceae bacterium]
MKKIILFALLIIASSVYSNVFGQSNVPAVPDNVNLQDNSLKMRSVEMERIKREETKAEAATFAPINSELKVKFPEIKEDFEGIQVSQSAIITAYSTGNTIDYAAIAANADIINKKAVRLDANLFPGATSQKLKDELNESKKKTEQSKTIRELIIELDNTIGSFVSSQIFANLKVIEPEVAIKTRADLLKIKELSEKLNLEAKKMKQ